MKFCNGKSVPVAERNAEAQDEHLQQACLSSMAPPNINMAQDARQPDANGR